jgi:hypothetical protein
LVPSPAATSRAFDRGFAARQFEHHVRQLPNCVFHGIADVHRVVITLGKQAVDPLDFVFDIAERTRLRAVAVDRERLTAQRLHDEVRHHAPVAWPHARSVRVENADDARVEPVVPVVRHRDRFGKPLRFIVDATRSNRIHVAPI